MSYLDRAYALRDKLTAISRDLHDLGIECETGVARVADGGTA